MEGHDIQPEKPLRVSTHLGAGAVAGAATGWLVSGYVRNIGASIDQGVNESVAPLRDGVVAASEYSTELANNAISTVNTGLQTAAEVRQDAAETYQAVQAETREVASELAAGARRLAPELMQRFERDNDTTSITVDLDTTSAADSSINESVNAALAGENPAYTAIPEVAVPTIPEFEYTQGSEMAAGAAPKIIGGMTTFGMLLGYGAFRLRRAFRKERAMTDERVREIAEDVVLNYMGTK